MANTKNEKNVNKKRRVSDNNRNNRLNKNIKPRSLASIIRELREWENKSPTDPKYIHELRNIITGFGEMAFEPMIKILHNGNDRARRSAPLIMAGIDPERSFTELIPFIDDVEISEQVNAALVVVGKSCVPDLIKIFNEKLISKESAGIKTSTDHLLMAIGEIRCPESSNFLTDLLDEYMANLPKGPFDPSKHEWKFKNVDFFHILEAIVRQQSVESIPHLKKVRDRFPSRYTEHLVCQIAIGRIVKRRPDEGFLPLEVMDIMFPFEDMKRALTGETGESDQGNWFEKEYGDYFTDDIYDPVVKTKKRRKI